MRSLNLSTSINNMTSMEICNKCGASINIFYACDHTNERKMCTECYQFIHWAINSNKDRICTSEEHDSQEYG